MVSVGKAGARDRALVRVFARAAICALAFSAIAPLEAAAQSDPAVPLQEDARLALVDHCVLNESARFGQYTDFTGRCKCASKALLGTLSQQEMQSVAKWRKPTSALKRRWADAWNGCG